MRGMSSLLLKGAGALLLLFILAITPATTQNSSCDTPDPGPDIMQQLIKELPKIEAHSISNSKSVTIVPVYFTTRREDDGSTGPGDGVDDILVNNMLSYLNTEFASINLQFEKCGEINYIDNSAPGDMTSPYSYVSSALNIYYTASTTGGAQTSAPWLAGENNILLMPYPSADLLSSILVHEVGHSYGLLHTHHGVNVYDNPASPLPNYTPQYAPYADHPYTPASPAGARELVLRQYDGSKNFPTPNCATGGDLICDTEASCDDDASRSATFPTSSDPNCHSSFGYLITTCPSGCTVNTLTCSYTGDYVDYNGDPLDATGNEIVKNYMSYFPVSCRTKFTPGQFTRMDYYNLIHRAYQYDASLCVNLSDYVTFENSSDIMQNVNIKLSHDTDNRYSNAITNKDGEFQGILYDTDVKADVSKLGSGSGFSYTTADWKNGISGMDIIALQKHVLGIQLLNGFQQIAADVNNSGSITALDASAIQSMLLSITTTFPAFSSPWRFTPEYIPTDYATEFNANPFNMPSIGSGAPYLLPTWEYPISNGLNGKSGFNGIKLGDLNASLTLSPFTSTSNELAEKTKNGCSKNSEQLTELYVPQTDIPANSQFELIVKSLDFNNLNGLQFGFKFDTDYMEVLSVETQNLPSFDVEQNVGLKHVENGEIRVLWIDNQLKYHSLKDDTPLMILKLKTKKAISNLNEYIQLDNSVFKNEFYGVGDCPIGGQLVSSIRLSKPSREFATDQAESSTTEIDIEHLNCFPNPTTGNINLLYKAVTDGKAELLITDSRGSLLKKSTHVFQKGMNKLLIDGADLPSGVLQIVIRGAKGKTNLTRVTKF